METSIEIVDEQYGIDPSFFLEKLTGIYQELKLKGSVTIKLGDEEESQYLNTTYRQKESPTDVLSFPLDEELPDGYYLGDIHVCYPVAERQAVENEVTLQQELLTLMIHGLIHLAGYDHETDEGEMMALQEKILEKLGL